MPAKANSLANVFRVLSGARDRKFFFEPELRLFQFKVWLLSEGNRSLDDSAVLFTSIMLRRRARLDRRRLAGATASELMDAALEREDYSELYDVVFCPPRTPYAFSVKASLTELRSKFKDARKYIDDLNQLTELRLRLHATKGYPHSLNAAQELDCKLKTGTATGYGRTILAKVHRLRQKREAFLLVAKRFDPGLLEFQTKVDGLPRELHTEVANRERFKSLFGRAITALEVLKPKGLTAEQLRAWTQVEPIPLHDVVRPFSKAELDEVQFFPTPRRAAETTRAGKRQKATRWTS
jgi:hypothetical protein